MPSYCSLCTNPDAKEINRAILNYASVRDTAGRYNLSKSAVHRHAHNCLPRLIQKMEAKQLRQARSLSQELEELEDTVNEVIENAKQNGDLELVLKGTDRRHKQVELKAKLRGEFIENQPNLLTMEQRADKAAELLHKAETKLIQGATTIETVQ